MKKLLKPVAKPLIAMFGLKPGTVIPNVSTLDKAVLLRLSWITLQFGLDDQKQEYVSASAGKHSFLLCATKLDGGPQRKPAKAASWVHLVDILPYELWEHLPASQTLVYGGFRVTTGREGSARPYLEGREFVAVEMPGPGRTLMFRNPASSSTHAWTPRFAVGLQDAMELRPRETAIALDSRITGNAELEDLLYHLQ